MNIKSLSGAIAIAVTLTAGSVVTSSADAAGLLKPANSSQPDLSIKEHHVNVVLEHSYAVTSVEQVFHNPSNKALEAIYSFPVPEHAAVGEFTYWIDGRPVTGEVVKKQQARQIYEQEKQAGRETALVEKDSHKTFDISVTPVQPNSDVRIKLVYIQPAHVDSGIGRYVYPLEDGGVDDQKNAFWSRNEVVDEKFSFNMTLGSGYPVDSIRLPQQPQASIQQLNPTQWQISMANQSGALSTDALASDEPQPIEQDPEVQQLNPVLAQTAGILPAASLNQDIVVYWRLKQDLPGSVDLISYKKATDSQGTFLMTLTPGDDLAAVQGGRDWIFVLDVSGSMQGKYSTLVEGVRQGLGKLQSDDRFKIVLFNNSATDFSKGFQAATPEIINPLLNQLEQYKPHDGTDLYAGISEGLKHLDADRSNAMILVTDGVANVGVTEKKRFLTLMEKADIRLFTFVMGNSANRPLLDGMTDVSNGFAISVSNADDIVGQLMLATSKMTHQALRDVELKIDGGRVTDLTPEQINSLYRGEQLTIAGHYHKPGPVQVTLTGKIGDQKRLYSTEVTLPESSLLHPELERIWAYSSIENMQAKMDYLGESSNEDTQQAITDLAIQYDLVTNYTSMLIVRDEVFKQLNIDRNNQQRTDTENNARQQRLQQPVKTVRADNQKPMFNPSNNRATLGGGSGAIGHWVLLLIAALLLVQFSNNRNRKRS
ncbi:VIT and vWA domain-containing protein [Amphritea japonica]|uniref:Ca-activated chloride channel homolog n=1 Tax=Amphritea japonica ATCC BAA-1530 TaxID=1278309 RepID=A0A7R6ST25_9GAMM|nr:VIT and VWA domain-containing protein [Amphritea japonica]BBB26177.1 Ca-activated chloride channel homolog [Amphritea japonica ATCC BAA-1530]